MRTIGQWRGGAASGDNNVPPQAPAEGLAMPVNPAILTDADVWSCLAQMAHAITIQAHAMTS